MKPKTFDFLLSPGRSFSILAHNPIGAEAQSSMCLLKCYEKPFYIMIGALSYVHPTVCPQLIDYTLYHRTLQDCHLVCTTINIFYVSVNAIG